MWGEKVTPSVWNRIKSRGQFTDMKSRRLVRITFPIILLIGIYFIGSSPDRPAYNITLPTVPADAVALEEHVANSESKHKLKPENNAMIPWYTFMDSVQAEWRAIRFIAILHESLE